MIVEFRTYINEAINRSLRCNLMRNVQYSHWFSIVQFTCQIRNISMNCIFPMLIFLIIILYRLLRSIDFFRLTDFIISFAQRCISIRTTIAVTLLLLFPSNVATAYCPVSSIICCAQHATESKRTRQIKRSQHQPASIFTVVTCAKIAIRDRFSELILFFLHSQCCHHSTPPGTAATPNPSRRSLPTSENSIHCTAPPLRTYSLALTARRGCYGDYHPIRTPTQRRRQPPASRRRRWTTTKSVTPTFQVDDLHCIADARAHGGPHLDRGNPLFFRHPRATDNHH